MKPLLQLVFFASGLSALFYQILWQRMLTLFGGADVYAVTLIVAAFMGGLGFGSLAGGYFADRLGIKARLAAFAAAEFGIALFGIASPWILYDVLYVRFGGLPLSTSVVGLTIFVVLLWPTFLMGMSLPLLARALTDDARQPADWVPILYGWNTVGAACGALFAVWVLFRTTSFTQGLQIAAGINAICGACAVVFSFTSRGVVQPASPVPKSLSSAGRAMAPGPVRFSFRTWMSIYLLSGFIALSLEIVWFRVIGVLIKSNAFTFGSLLSVYLLGVGAGALIVRFRRLRVASPATAFFLLQAAVVLYAVGSIAIFVAAAGRLQALEPLWRYLGGYEPADLMSGSRSLPLLATLYAAIPAFLIGPPTLMMGMSFGYLQLAVQTDLNALGRRVGALQAANILGSVLGTVITGLVLLQWLGSSGSLRVLAALGGVFSIILATTPNARLSKVVRIGVALAATGVAVAIVPSSTKLWAAAHSAPTDAVIVGEDRTGLSLLKDIEDGSTVVFANGLGQSQLPFGGIHTALGALPALIHPAPQSIAVIGLGSGDTLFSAGCRAETRLLQDIEIIEPEFATLERMNERQRYAGLKHLFADRRFQYAFTDGRAFIRKGGRQYDIIEADALRPNSAFAGNLYSLEYFELIRDSLSDGGFGVTWAPTVRVRHTFIKAFPYVLRLGEIMIGSRQPIRFDPDAVKARLFDSFTRRHFSQSAIDIDAILEPFIHATPVTYGPELDRSMVVDVNRDLFPKDEFMVQQPRTRLLGDDSFRSSVP